MNRARFNKYCHPFGRGFGLSAEFIGLLKRFALCRRKGIQFCLQKINVPKGFAVEHGWRDYFAACFDELEVLHLANWNRPHFPLGRLPVCRLVASQLLRLGTDADYFVFDDLARLPDVADCGHPNGDDYWPYMQMLAKCLWRYNCETRDEISLLRNRVNIPTGYVSIHIRRGDKTAEAPYVPIERYVRLLKKMEDDYPREIYIATDDSMAYDDLRQALGPTFTCFRNEGFFGSGYDQSNFNSADKPYRRRMTVAFMFDLEMIFNSQIFIGSSTSNVFYIARYFRANEGLLNLEDIDSQ